MNANKVKRQWVYNFLDAEMAPKWFADKASISLSAICNLKKAQKAGKSVKPIPRSGAKKTKQTELLFSSEFSKSFLVTL